MMNPEQSREFALDEQPVRGTRGRRGGRLLLVPVILVAAAAAAGGLWLANKGRTGRSGPDIFAVRRGTLNITVSESGALQAERMERIRSKVKQVVSILYLVPEGTYISEEDVQDGRILVELDASQIRERSTRQEITVQNAVATLTRETEDYQILLKQNESDIRAARLNAKFARMELDYYLGKDLAAEINAEADFGSLAERDTFGGAALQRKSQLENNVLLAEEEVAGATDQVNGTRRLLDKNYVTRNQLRADELALTRCEASHEQSERALDLFLWYELPRTAEQMFANWQERELALDRVLARAKSEDAQARAKLKSAEATHGLEKQELDRLREEIENAIIRATRPGLVVYASSTDRWRRMSNPIEEGTTVRERQEIIHLPDLSSMVAELKVHESVVNQISPGQKVVVTVDAVSGLRLEGKVSDVAGLPDPQHFLQDVNVFTTSVKILGTHPALKPGMSCAAEITVATIPDALYVPVQAVMARGDTKVCYVVTDRGQETQVVETGLFDDKFVEITSGLQEGERVLLTPPFLPSEGEQLAALETQEAPGAEEEEQLEPEGPAGPAAPPQGLDEIMKRMKAAGITMEDLKRWRSGEMTSEDRKKLESLGITPEGLRDRSRRSSHSGAGDQDAP